MTFILTNDDGINAPGIQALRVALQTVTQQAGVMIAPKGHLSGCSHQLTTGRSIPIERRSEQAIAIGGTPADCARIAVSYLQPDVKFVLSGINAGGNLGADTYVSGTVAAVREATLLRIPGIAISHYIKRGYAIDWAIASQLTAQVLDKLLHQPLEPGTFWNVNLPHLLEGDRNPKMIFCPLCSQPLPTEYWVENELFQYVGEYAKRARDPGSDVEVCFSGDIAITKIQVW